MTAPAAGHSALPHPVWIPGNVIDQAQNTTTPETPPAGTQQIVSELLDVATYANKWSRANTIATLEMAVFALFVSVLARGTSLTSEQIESILNGAGGLVGTSVVPAAIAKSIVEYLRSDR